jgi:pyruvate,water dikinase
MLFIRKISELDQSDLPIAGGKGANLGALLQAGLPVPGGFIITTDGYRAFMTANHLDADLHRILDSTQMDDLTSLESASGQIRDCFHSGQIPPNLTAEICQAYLSLSNQPLAVAVRSSATAEDLPDLSFAGQQDTYLNILGEEALLDAVVRCWASLWTARAIGYRARNAIAHDNIALAVVVQLMVQSEVSGVLFTANPLTGKRSETVIDATFGLGEALVSGQVEPDHYVVETGNNRILSKTLGSKALTIQGQPGGGTITIAQDEARLQALPDEQILTLTHLGQQAAANFGTPQDMEWAWAEGRWFIVQSRPITSLYPLPVNESTGVLEAYLSFGVWQGMLDPYTPLGQDLFSNLVSGMGELFNVKIKPEEQRTLLAAGDRLFVNITGLLRNSIGRRFLPVFGSAIDPISGEILKKLLEDPRFVDNGTFSMRARLNLVRGIFPFAKNIVFNLLFPEQARFRLQNIIDKSLEFMKAQCAEADNLIKLLSAINEKSIAMVKNLMPALVAGVASGQGIPLQFLIRMSAEVPRGSNLIMELSRGLPNNVTTEMDLALWETAQAIRAEPDTSNYFTKMETAILVADFRNGKLPLKAQAVIESFFEKYGMRGVGEIDIGRRRWNEDPTSIFQVLKSYLQIGEDRSPSMVFQQGIEKALQAETKLMNAFAALPGGWFKARLARALVYRFRELGGLRELPKFSIIQQFGIFRKALLTYGDKFVEQKVLNDAEDVFFLHLPELKALGNGETRDWQALIIKRRATYQRELRRRQVPRVMLSDGTAYYDAPTPPADNGENTLSGSPVSAGTVEGMVHVVFDPHNVQLTPGEILVCPATDPAWTPLFLTAGGLVMEVGGMMTHGSVVAREYGIPAVVGVTNATERLKTGQKVRVDGANGRITILQD